MSAGRASRRCSTARAPGSSSNSARDAAAGPPSSSSPIRWPRAAIRDARTGTAGSESGSRPLRMGKAPRPSSMSICSTRTRHASRLTADGEVVQPSEVLYQRPILVERGSFRPVTKLTLDLLESAREQFVHEPQLDGAEPVVLMEMTLRSLTDDRGVDHEDFLSRAEILQALGNHVLISNCAQYFQLVEILSRYTNKMIGLALGLPSLREIADERYYADLPGGRLEA